MYKLSCNYDLRTLDGKKAKKWRNIEILTKRKEKKKKKKKKVTFRVLRLQAKNG